jgi:hypothetical protein
MEAPEYEEEAPQELYLIDLLDYDSDDNTPGADIQSLPTSDIISESHEPPISSPIPSISDGESVLNTHSKIPISPIYMAFGLFCEKASISRIEYKYLREVWAMGQGDPDHTILLPVKLDTLKQAVYTQLLMLQLKRKPIIVTFLKQPTLPSKQKASKLERIRITRKL